LSRTPAVEFERGLAAPGLAVMAQGPRKQKEAESEVGLSLLQILW